MHWVETCCRGNEGCSVVFLLIPHHSSTERQKSLNTPTLRSPCLPPPLPSSLGAVGISEPDATGGQPNGWQGRDSSSMRKCYTATNNSCGYKQHIEMPFSLWIALTKQSTHAQITIILRAALHKSMHKMPLCLLLSKNCEWFSSCQASQECWD